MAFVGDSLDRFASEKATGAALTCGANSFSWQELAARINRIGAMLCERTDHASYVVLRLRDPADLIVCFFACARTGRVATVMDPDWPSARHQQFWKRLGQTSSSMTSPCRCC